jgi:hypothetical protein
MRTAAGLALLVAAGCHSGSPPRVDVLMASVPTSKEPLLRSTDGTLRGVSPLTEIQIGFDRPLSHGKLGGSDTGTAPQIVDGLVQIVWENAPPGSREILVHTVYSDSASPFTGNEGRATISLFTAADLPSGARLRLRLDRERIFSQEGDPLEGPQDFFVETIPFSVRIAENSQVITNITPATLVFSNRGAEDLPGHVTVAVAGAPLSVLVRDANPHRNEFIVLGPGGVWPQPGRYEVTVDAGAADDYGVKVPAPVSLSFEVR